MFTGQYILTQVHTARRKIDAHAINELPCAESYALHTTR